MPACAAAQQAVLRGRLMAVMTGATEAAHRKRNITD
jgi:hypothetical protein